MSTRRTSGSSSRRRPRSRTATRSRSFPPSPGAVEPALTMPRLRVRLTFPPELIQQPIVDHLVKGFDLIPHIRRAEVEADYGCVRPDLHAVAGGLRRGAGQAVAPTRPRGRPTGPPPPERGEAANAAIDGHAHPSGMAWGPPRLRRRIAGK